LQREFETRRKQNPRYSVRALALLLKTDHSTLAQILRGTASLDLPFRKVVLARIRKESPQQPAKRQIYVIHAGFDLFCDPAAIRAKLSASAETQNPPMRWFRRASNSVQDAG